MQQLNSLPQALDHALAFHKRGQIAQAEILYAKVLESDPANYTAQHMLGVVRLQQGRSAEALALIGGALKSNPAAPDALLHYGVALQGEGRLPEALKTYDKALTIRPGYVSALNNRGNVLRDMKRLRDALASYEGALAIQPDYLDALYNRGIVLWGLKRFPEALASCDAALALKPDHAQAHYNRGIVLQDMKRPLDALSCYDRALALMPDLAPALNNRGSVLRDLKRFEEALASFDRALAISPDFVGALNNRGVVLQNFRRNEEALHCFDRVLALEPDHVSALTNRGNVLFELKRLEEALASHDRALEIEPGLAEAMFNRGTVLLHLKRFAESLESYESALAADPAHPYALGGAASAVLNLCDWPRTERLAGAIKSAVAARTSVIPPFTFVNHCDDPALQRACAEIFTKDRIPVVPPRLWDGAPYRNEKIRLAYLSADFHQHATTFLMVELFERHDRDRFEVIGISFGPDDGSETRARVVKAFDRFYDVRAKSDREVAHFLKAAKVDIAVDLKGHTQDNRLGIFAHRPCPVQVNYLGFPGTIGADFIDYIIADPVVLPFDQQPFFSEKIVHLPDCYQPNDSMRAISEKTPSRTEVGLPEKEFVFCCFNNNWKIAPPMFEIWMRLLAQVPGSVFWFLEDNEAAKINLRAAAAVRGIDPARLVFSPRIALPDHLARQRLAGLFLDTLPNNAHTTSSDALWAGLPIVTCLGECFAGRVAGSLLHAVGLDELVTRSLDEYEALALALARDPARLGAIRQKLARNRSSMPLFDADRFRRHIEAAYARMVETAARGEPAQSFAVAPQ